jgi:hypothetical protein
LLAQRVVLPQAPLEWESLQEPGLLVLPQEPQVRASQGAEVLSARASPLRVPRTA